MIDARSEKQNTATLLRLARKHGERTGAKDAAAHGWSTALAATMVVNARPRHDWSEAEADAYVAGYTAAMLRKLRELGK